MGLHATCRNGSFRAIETLSVRLYNVLLHQNDQTPHIGSGASNFMKHHACLCNDHTSPSDLVLDQHGLIHYALATKTSPSATTKKVRHASLSWVFETICYNYISNFYAPLLQDHPLSPRMVKKTIAKKIATTIIDFFLNLEVDILSFQIWYYTWTYLVLYFGHDRHFNMTRWGLKCELSRRMHFNNMQFHKPIPFSILRDKSEWLEPQ